MECKSCEKEGREEHECPFQTELNDDQTLCNCCEECEYGCTQDI